MKSTENKSKIIHCSIVGDNLVGKTSLVKNFLQDECADDQGATVFDNFAGDVSVQGSQYMVSIFDTTGQHEFGGLRYLPYAQSKIVIVCYSVIDRASFNNVSNFWIHEVKKHCRKQASIILVATHCDMSNGGSMLVRREEGMSLARTIGASDFMETSKYDLKNVSKLFERVVAKAIQKKRNVIQMLFGR